MHGSKMASVLAKMCSDGGLYKYVAVKLGFCSPEGGVSRAYLSLEPSYPGLVGIAQTIAPRLSGAMCGTSSYGLSSIYSAEMVAVAQLAGFADKNDGVVPWSSCNVNMKVNGSDFVPDYHHQWYAAAVNHIDASCYEG